MCHAKSQFGLATQMGVCACYTTRSLTGGIGGFNGARAGAFLNKHRQFPNRLDTGDGTQSPTNLPSGSVPLATLERSV